MSFRFFICQKTLTTLDPVDEKLAIFREMKDISRFLFFHEKFYVVKFRRKSGYLIKNHYIWTWDSLPVDP